MRYFILTFGCQQNHADSERMAGAFEARGFTKASGMEEADYITINTCMVRQHAEDRVYGLGKKISQLKEKKENLKVTVTGCMTGAAVRDRTGRLLKVLKARMPWVDDFMPIDEVGFDVPIKRESSHHAWVVISNGCNNYCSYCIVPFTRGFEASRPFEDVMNEVKDLASKGYQRITLLGQNVNSYGSDFVKEKLSDGRFVLPDGEKVIPVMVKRSMGRVRVPTLFPYLLQKVVEVEGIEKVSFLSSNPWDFNEDLIAVMAKNPKIDRYLHLPVQSGDAEVLRRMNRWYTPEQYLALVTRIRKQIPEIEIGTDIIVGFPGETEQHFQNTVKLCQKANFCVAYIGMYSPRPGTVSAKMFPDEISREEKKRRFHSIDRLVNGKARPPHKKIFS